MLKKPISKNLYKNNENPVKRIKYMNYSTMSVTQHFNFNIKSITVYNIFYLYTLNFKKICKNSRTFNHEQIKIFIITLYRTCYNTD